MLKFALGRLVQSLATLLVASLVIFLLGRATGDPTAGMAALDATAEEIEALRERFGLNRSIVAQYLSFLGDALRGDFGISLSFPGQPVWDIIADRMPATIKLAVLAIGFATLLSVPVGVLAAVYRDSWVDGAGKAIALLGQSTPSFWLAIVLIWVFSVQLGWLPTSGAGSFRHMILPAIAMGWFQVASVMRLTRSAMLEALDSEYVKLARIKGQPEWRIVWKHAFKNAAIVPLTYFGIIVGILMTGAVVVETVFAYPGAGRLAVDAVRARDFLLIQAIVLLFATIFIVSNLLVDILYGVLDPRVRDGKGLV